MSGACGLGRGVTIAAFALLLVSGPALAQTGRAVTQGPVSKSAGTCGTCHPSERVQHEKSAHADEGVTCVSCHGGNDATLDKAAAHGAGYRGRITKSEEPKLCASCHSDESRMRPYDLPVDQWALYETSGHGKALAKGDTRVAVCSSCHGAHEIRAASDPASPTFVTNIPRTCGTCHGDAKLMGATPHKGMVYPEYMTSIHAQELLTRGNRQAPTCVNCHGVHGATPPAVGDVGKVCAHCHTAERRYFASGPHGTKLAKAGLSECASCHSDHAIQAALPARLDTVCSVCHGADSNEAKLGRTMLADYRGADKELERAAAIIAKADAVPVRTEDYQARLEEGRTLLREALPAAHSVDAALVKTFTSRAQSVGHEIQAEIQHKLDDLRWRKIGLLLFWFYVVLTLLVLRRFREQGAREI